MTGCGARLMFGGYRCGVAGAPLCTPCRAGAVARGEHWPRARPEPETATGARDLAMVLALEAISVVSTAPPEVALAALVVAVKGMARDHGVTLGSVIDLLQTEAPSRREKERTTC